MTAGTRPRTRAGSSRTVQHDGPRVPADWLDLDPAELARRDPSSTAAEWAEAQAAARDFQERVEHPEVVERWEDVPTFATEGEEADYWETHMPGPAVQRVLDERGVAWAAREALREQARLRRGKGTQAARAATPPKQPAPVSLRLEADTVRRLRALAERKGTRYQSLLKQFVVERLYEEEKREGLVAPAPAAG